VQERPTSDRTEAVIDYRERFSRGPGGEDAGCVKAVGRDVLAEGGDGGAV